MNPRTPILSRTDTGHKRLTFVVPHRRMLQLYEGLPGWIIGPALPAFVVDGLDFALHTRSIG